MNNDILLKCIKQYDLKRNKIHRKKPKITNKMVLEAFEMAKEMQRKEKEKNNEK